MAGSDNESSSFYAECNFTTPSYFPEVHVLIFSTECFLSFITVAVNGVILLAFLTDGNLRAVPSNAYVIHLTIVDSLIGALAQPLKIIWRHLTSGRGVIPWLDGLVFWFNDACIFMSISMVILVGIDRIRMVRNPLQYNSSQSLRRNNAYAAIAWFVNIAYALLYYLVEFMTYPPMYSCTPDDVERYLTIVPAFEVAVYFIVPFLSVISVNTVFIVALRRQLSAINRTLEVIVKTADTIQKRDVPSMGKASGNDSQNEEFSANSTTGRGWGETLTPTGPAGREQISVETAKTSMSTPGASASIGRKQASKRIVHNAAKNFFAYVAVYLVFQFPFYAAYLWELAFGPIQYAYRWDIVYLFVHGNSAVNPLLSIRLNRKLENKVLAICRLNVPQRRQPNDIPPNK